MASILIYVSAGGCSGYAVAAQAYMQGILQLGHSLSWSPRAWKKCRPYHAPSGIPTLDACLGLALPTNRVLLHVVPAQLRLLNEEFRGYQKFVYTVWETDQLPDDWVGPLNQARQILVPCHWNREVMKAAGVRAPIEVVPHLLSEELASLSGAQASLPFTFYSIGPWSRRKGLDLLVEAFCRAFSGDEPVRLVLKTDPIDITRYSQSWAVRHLSNAWNTSQRAVQRIRRGHSRPPSVQLLCGQLALTSIQELHATSHCYVSLTRSEGWGLGAFESATVGNPVIMTGYGGQMDFLDPALAYLVDYRLVACDVGPWESYYRGQRWADPNLDQAAGYMREVYANFSLARQRAQRLKSKICDRFSGQRIMPRFWEVLNR